MLLTKLEHYGIRGITLDLLAPFLSNRYQYVSLNNHQPPLKNNTYGVPQGSVLGPLLFILYINDFNACVTSMPRLFADDTCLVIKDKHWNNLHEKVTGEISSLNKWMIANKLTLNLSKSNLILIQPKNNSHVANSYTIPSYFVPDLTAVTMSSYSGVTFDQSLSFEPHISNMARKLSKAVGILSKIKA